MDKEQEKLLNGLTSYMHREHLTAKEIASMLGVSANTMTNWRKGGSMSVSNRKTVAKLVEDYSKLKVTSPSRSPECSFDVPSSTFVPLLTVAQAASLRANSFGPPCIEEGEQSGFMNAKPGDFAIVVSGRSMMPWYPPGTHILVRQGELPKTGDRVVAMLASDLEPIFKVFVDLGDCFELLSINEDDSIAPIHLNKMARDEWFWVWPIIESKRDERALDAAMKEFGIHHFWEKRVNESLNKKR